MLDAARRLFALRGFHGASIGEIAREAGCSEPIVYRHFDSKQALFAAVLEDGAEALLTQLEDTIGAHPGDPFSALTLYANRTIMDSRMAELVRIRSLAVALADEPEVLEALRLSMNNYLDLVTHAAAQSQAAGCIAPDVEPRHLAELWAGIGFLGGFVHAVGGERALEDLRSTVSTLVALATGSARRIDEPAPQSAPGAQVS